MRAPNVRVALVAVAAVAVFAGGSLATRHGPVGGSGPAGGGDRAVTAGATAAATAPTTSPGSLGTMSERLARLPPVAPGELAGVLDLGGIGCSQQTIDLGTLVRTGTPIGVCAVSGARFGIRLRDIRRNPRVLSVVDLEGHLAETVAVPAGWDWWGLTRAGVVFCKGLAGAGRLRQFAGPTRPLSSCPLTQDRTGRLLFPGPANRSVVDGTGRRLVALDRPLPPFATVRPFGDGLLAVETSVYRQGRLLASFAEPNGVVLGASRDGKVALVSDGVGTRLYVYRDGTPHAIDQALSTRGGAVAPDGSRVLVQGGPTMLVELDATTLRPLARLPLGSGAEVLDWRPGPGG